MLGPLEQAAMQEAIEIEEERKSAMKRNYEAYKGKFADALTVVNGKANDNIKVNRVRGIVDSSVALLFGNVPTFELPKPDGVTDSGARSEDEKYLDEVFRHNSWAAKLLDYGLNGAILGTPFLRIVPTQPFPKLQVMDPMCMSIRWSELDVDEVEAYIWQYNSIDPQSKRPIIRRQLCERQMDASGKATSWLLTDQHATLENSRYNNWIVDKLTTWAHSWPPYIHNKNLPAPNEAYGMADYGDVIVELNHAKNFILSNANKINRLHAHPKLWGRGVNAAGISFGPDDMLLLDDEQAEVGQLAPAINSEGASSLGKEVDEAIEMETRTPALLLGRDDGSGIPPSGIALRIKLIPASDKLQMKRNLYEPMLVELCRRLLDLAGRGDDKIAQYTWPEPLPVDPEAERRVLLIDQQLGASVETTLTKAGYDYATEQAHKETEATSADKAGENALNAFINAPDAGMSPAQQAQAEGKDLPNGVEGV